MKAEEDLDQLDYTVNQLVRKHGIVNVIRSVVSACDRAADFAHLCNDKRLEDYWRRSAVAIFDAIKCIGDLPEKTNKY